MSDSTTNTAGDIARAAPLLAEGQIRLLALKPGDGDDLLQGHIHVVDAASGEIPYEAVSYVWGGQYLADIIQCELDSDGGIGLCLPLTQNAADALRAVRKSDGVRMVWIDAVCISQDSREEKTAQVAIMDSIFANAAAVLIWLGADDGVRSVAAVELAGRIHECFGDDVRRRSFVEPVAGKGKVVDPALRQSCYDDLGSVLPLFECEWFWRLWCVQELALAKKALVHWGSAVVTWEAIMTVAAFIEAGAQLDVAHKGYAGVHNVVMLECLREQVRVNDVGRMPFSRLLSLTRRHGVTEPCDRIFSLLGLDRRLSMSSNDFRDAQYAEWLRSDDDQLFIFHTLPTIQPLVTPDYSQGIDRLYLATARALLARERNLHLLSFVQHEAQPGHGSLPSWVPQWHVGKHKLITQFDLLHVHPVYSLLSTALAKSTIRVGPTVCVEGKPSEFHALAGQHPPDGFTVDDDDTLHAQGLLLAVVTKSCSNAKFADDSSHQWLATLRQWYQTVSAWFAQDSRQDLLNEPSDQLEAEIFRAFHRALLGGHFRAKDVFLGLRSELDSFRAFIRSDSGGGEDTNLFPTTRAFVTQICRSRTLFLTDGGQLGIVPQCLEPGDRVCFLAGAAVPLLLRPCSNAEAAHGRWILVGETYVDGLAGASPDYQGAEDLDALHEADDDDSKTRALASMPATQKQETFLQVLKGARTARWVHSLLNSKMDAGVPGQIYYSDPGKIQVRYPAERHSEQTFSASSDLHETGEVPGVMEFGGCERMLFCIN